jgi:catechol 2,3-dioxygenase-like lactoylglutathione lyase family enzyme
MTCATDVVGSSVKLDSVQIGVSDLLQASRSYEALLGMPPASAGREKVRFQLRRGAVELESGNPGLHSLTFTYATPPCTWPCGIDSYHGLDVRLVLATEASLAGPVPATAAEAIDHVVVSTADPERAVALWRDRLQVRLALDREFPERGLRMCFFRSDGITLEFVSALSPPAGPAGVDRLHGLAYRVANLRAFHARLTREGLDVSPIRAGQKPGTQVSTVRSGTEGVPTLLICDSASTP